uniref:Uncharacterized protein TCIL3000_10_20 n=1 Tax=Trypanosoma congolense (strain IL3000) TaxID=1068625 RepID=G0UV29_TRYCI|nr:unnamed protein product [Trypanosoma congolense IL3000]
MSLSLIGRNSSRRALPRAGSTLTNFEGAITSMPTPTIISNMIQKLSLPGLSVASSSRPHSLCAAWYTVLIAKPCMAACRCLHRCWWSSDRFAYITQPCSHPCRHLAAVDLAIRGVSSRPLLPPTVRLQPLNVSTMCWKHLPFWGSKPMGSLDSHWPKTVVPLPLSETPLSIGPTSTPTPSLTNIETTPPCGFLACPTC